MANKYKVGDLVILNELQFVSTALQDIEDEVGGKIGVISEVLRDDKERYDFFISLYFDYVVLVGGEEIMVFEEELDPFVKFCESCECDPCDCGWGHH